MHSLRFDLDRKKSIEMAIKYTNEGEASAVQETI